MNRGQFTSFLKDTLGLCAHHSADGAIHYVFMDWRHVGEMLAAGAEVFDDLKNMCVWVKSNAGQGSFYRSQHELVLVFKNGEGAHLNNFGLGAGGRNRSNVWRYAGVNAFRAGRMDELTMHPTVKPVALIADAMRDCSRRGSSCSTPLPAPAPPSWRPSTSVAAPSAWRSIRIMSTSPSAAGRPSPGAMRSSRAPARPSTMSPADASHALRRNLGGANEQDKGRRNSARGSNGRPAGDYDGRLRPAAQGASVQARTKRQPKGSAERREERGHDLTRHFQHERIEVQRAGQSAQDAVCSKRCSENCRTTRLRAIRRRPLSS